MHPDKMCDRISDAILDAFLEQDPYSRVAVETMGGHGEVYITGEVTTKGTLTHFQISNIVERISGVKHVKINIALQSPEIANGVDIGGAGDQGIMNGYAYAGNEDMLPMEMYYARSLGQYIYEKFPYDGKTQVTVNENNHITAIVASFQNTTERELNEMVRGIGGWLAMRLHPEVVDYELHLNPAGDWTQGGFDADAGVTGRKLAVDNYGASIPIGGGAFSGKDATKVDRSGAYMARRVAVDILNRNRDHVEAVFVQLAYAIGVIKPIQAVAHLIEQDGSVHEVNLLEEEGYDASIFEPNNMIQSMRLREPIFEKLATKGHFTERVL